MATEPLEYKITFDTSEVVQKLQEVKNQMDVAFGAQSYNSAGPDPYPFSELFNSAKGTSSESFTQGFGKANIDMSNMRETLKASAESSRLGFSKFREDMELGGLISGWGKQRTSTQYLDYDQSKAFATSGGLAGMYAKAKFGFRYDSTMPIHKSE
jgi:hypothetical protein